MELGVRVRCTGYKHLNEFCTIYHNSCIYWRIEVDLNFTWKDLNLHMDISFIDRVIRSSLIRQIDNY